ncbi:outer membrane protein assembly factor BamB family protein [Streptomyces sp. enrichment culture]|uniref:outer membrane protein assembly factor BamB family protein n=1 Tax=Streptomyces sp. enrichment culture TaxID=1795815 RepID=UPI003F5596E8
MALLVLGGAGYGAWYMFVGSPSNNVLWSVPVPKREGDLGAGPLKAETRGTWFTDEAVVHTLPDGIKAYDLDTGEQLWATALPGDSNQSCVAPENSSGDIGIVAYGENEACDHLAAYDLGSGKELWHRDLRPGDSTSKHDVSVARAGNVVVVNAGKTVLALNASDGTPAWDPKRFATDQCPSGRFTGGKVLVRVRTCVIDDAGGEDFGRQWDEVSLIDPATGRARWTYRHDVPEDSLGGDLSNNDVISTSPLVLLRKGQDGEALFALDEGTGKVRSEFSPAMPAKYVQTQDAEGSPWSEAGAFGDTFVMGASEGNDGDVMVAYDLDSGKQLWKIEPVEFRRYYPLPAAGGDRILAYVTGNDNDKGPELVEFGARDGAMTTVVEYPADIHRGMSVFATPYWHDDRLYVSAVNTQTTYDQQAYSLAALPTTE